MVFIAFGLGVAAGGGAVLWWQARPEPPPPFYADEHAVELMLFEAVPPRTHPSGRESDSPLQVDGAVLLSGLATSTVLGIGTPDDSLDVRAPALPVTVSPTARYQSVNLEIIVGDCKAATRWTPVDRPFTITWRDEHGRAHLDRAGDFGRSMANSLIRYIDGACDNPPNR